MRATSNIAFSAVLPWLAGVELPLLRHAYPDRTRFVSLGLSIASAALVGAVGIALGIGTLTLAWIGWLLFLPALVGCMYYLRQAFSWAWAGLPNDFNRRLSLLAAIMVASGLLLSWPVLHFILGPAAHHNSPAAMPLLTSAIVLTILLVLLVPVYGIAASRHGSYARALTVRQAFYHDFSSLS